MQVLQKGILLLRAIGVCCGYIVDPKSVESITSKIRKKPNNISVLRSLLGLVGYLEYSSRRLIPNFSPLVKPLHLLLKNKDLKRGSK